MITEKITIFDENIIMPKNILIHRENVANVLQTVRVQKGLSLEEVANLSGIMKKGTLRRIEENRLAPTTEQLYALCDALEIEIKINDIKV